MPKLHTLNGNSYQVLTNFEDTSEKDCIKMDKKNEKIYMQLLSQANSAEKKLRNSVLSFNLEIPPPPRPCNRDRYILWKKRNVEKPVIPQSRAVLFLNEQGYALDKDYEAYQAIELSKEVKREKGIEDTEADDTTKLFDNVFSNEDDNVMRRRSSLKMNSLNRRMKNEINDFSGSFRKTNTGMQDSFNSLFPEVPNTNQSQVGHAPPHVGHPPPQVGHPPPHVGHQPINNRLFEMPKPSAPPMTHNIVYPEKNFDFSF